MLLEKTRKGSAAFQALWKIKKRLEFLERVAELCQDPSAVDVLKPRREKDELIVGKYGSGEMDDSIIQILLGKSTKIMLNTSGLFYSCVVHNNVLTAEGLDGPEKTLAAHADFVTVVRHVLSQGSN